MYLRWAIYATLNYLFKLVCYVTNPIVVLFCNEQGELPSIFKFWQTWDDSCNPRFYITRIVPKWLSYEYDEYYLEYWEEIEGTGRERCYSRLLKEMTSTKDRLKRYICRVMWLNRNCGYGFSFYLLGAVVNTVSIKVVEANGVKVGTAKTIDGNKVFIYKNDKRIGKYLKLKIFIGWKIPSNDSHKSMKLCMLADRVWLQFTKGGN